MFSVVLVKEITTNKIAAKNITKNKIIAKKNYKKNTELSKTVIRKAILKSETY